MSLVIDVVIVRMLVLFSGALSQAALSLTEKLNDNLNVTGGKCDRRYVALLQFF